MTSIEPVLTRRSRIAVIGAGVSGLGAAWALRNVHDVTVFEKDSRLGGHANTVTIDYDGTSIDVDTGFIVYNELNYPTMTALFAERGVGTGIYYPVPNHLLPAYNRNLDLPETERAAREVLSLPVYPSLTEAELVHIVESVNAVASAGVGSG